MAARFGKELLPGIFSVSEHDRRELTDLVFDGTSRYRLNGLLRRGALNSAHQVDQRQRVHAGKITDSQHQHDAAETESSDATDSRRAESASVFHILALTLTLPAHGSPQEQF